MPWKNMVQKQLTSTQNSPPRTAKMSFPLKTSSMDREIFLVFLLPASSVFAIWVQVLR